MLNYIDLYRKTVYKAPLSFWDLWNFRRNIGQVIDVVHGKEI